MKFGKTPNTGSQDIVQTRKCHANADAKGIRTKSIFPLPLSWGTKSQQKLGFIESVHLSRP